MASRASPSDNGTVTASFHLRIPTRRRASAMAASYAAWAFASATRRAASGWSPDASSARLAASASPSPRATYARAAARSALPASRPPFASPVVSSHGPLPKRLATERMADSAPSTSPRDALASAAASALSASFAYAVSISKSIALDCSASGVFGKCVENLSRAERISPYFPRSGVAIARILAS